MTTTVQEKALIVAEANQLINDIDYFDIKIASSKYLYRNKKKYKKMVERYKARRLKKIGRLAELKKQYDFLS